MRKILILFSFFTVLEMETIAVSQSIKIKDEKMFWELRDSNYSKNIDFKEEDFFGIWEDEKGKSDKFILNKNLKFEFGYKSGQCVIKEKLSNEMLLQCSGDLGKKLKSQYIKLKIYYFANDVNQASLRMNITFNSNEKCAKNEDITTKNKCFKNGEDQHYEMYLKMK